MIFLKLSAIFDTDIAIDTFYLTIYTAPTSIVWSLQHRWWRHDLAMMTVGSMNKCAHYETKQLVW